MAAAAAAASSARAPAAWRGIRVITVDATGTMIYHREPVPEIYCRCAARVGARPPTVEAMKVSFKAAFKSSLEQWPCFGHAEGLSTREWWRRTVHAAFEGAGAGYSDREFARVFQSVYQYYGTPGAYFVFDDVKPFLEWASGRFVLGLITNNVDRVADNTLPLLGLHEHLKFFVVSQHAGCEKPSREIFEVARQEAADILGTPVAPSEMLHIGDNFAADYCGARASGMAAALVSRQGVAQYQTWLTAPEFEGKADEEMQEVTSFAEIRLKLESVGFGAGPESATAATAPAA